jgi:putative transposase
MTDYRRNFVAGGSPLKHELVERVRDWPYSSFHRMVQLGIYLEDWGGDAAELSGDFGERS